LLRKIHSSLYLGSILRMPAIINGETEINNLTTH
jgi:hypothetical protein